ncbi:MAG: LuxR C-terminal-related transcriptional regulator [Elioraea tepidiphila]
MAAEHPSGWLTTLIGGIGTREFPDHLAEALGRGFGVDHVCLFGLSDREGARAFATLGRIDRRLAAALAADYAERDWFRRDPNLQRLRRAGPVAREVCARLDASAYAQDYFLRFFRSAGIVDKLALCLRTADGWILYANFHRLAASGAFPPETRRRLAEAVPVIGAALAQDRALRRGEADPLGVLTRREREVCRGILSGLSSEGIALSLGVSRNTVLTLRRRAYARLGITSQAELFRRVCGGV